MVSTLSVLLSVVVFVSSKVAEARLIAVNSADYVDSSSLLNVPPYYSYMGYDRPASLDDLHYQQLLAIADQYNLKLSDLYQLYDLSRTSLPSATPHDYVNIIQQVAEAVQLERMRRGLAPSSHLEYSTPVADPITERSYVLHRRDVSDTLGNFYNQMTENMSEAYQNMYNMANDMIPKVTESFKNQISDIINGSTPDAAMNYADNLTDKMTSSLRNMI